MTQDESQKLFTSKSAREINQTHNSIFSCFHCVCDEEDKTKQGKIIVYPIYREGNLVLQLDLVLFELCVCLFYY